MIQEPWKTGDHKIVDLDVVGSNPITRPSFSKIKKCDHFKLGELRRLGSVLGSKKVRRVSQLSL